MKVILFSRICRLINEGECYFHYNMQKKEIIAVYDLGLFIFFYLTFRLRI
jgi:hypothetical protein